jgi:hypothetical protein
LPIAAGILLYHEQVPEGTLGALRVAGFVCVVGGATAVARARNVWPRPTPPPFYAA